MMKYSIGYQLPDEFESVVDLCRDYHGSISNVYFSWADEKSGRLPLCSERDADAVKTVLLRELKEIRVMGKTLTLLLNANCYGEEAVSQAFRDRILFLCEYLKKEVDIGRVTTTSPFAADVISSHFRGEIKVIASVNMRVGTIRAMEQLSDYFDGFYMAKECNRNPKKIEELKAWCDRHGKALCILANSGCMPYCGFQTFHDNLVAHQGADSIIDDSWGGLPSPCHKYFRSMKKEDAMAYFLQGTWVRPEDTHYYEPYFSEMKLATRMHGRMRMIVGAYARGSYRSNLLDLTEPSFSRDLKGVVLDNTRVTKGFFEHILGCDKNCEVCDFCKKTAQNAAVIL